MDLVTVKQKFQVLIPQRVREEVGIDVGDVLEATVERGRIVFQPKAELDAGIAESMAEFDAGKGHGPFETHAEFLKALHKQARKPVIKKSRSRARK